MAWDLTVLYQGPNTYVAHVESTAAPDTTLTIVHGLGTVPLLISVMNHNAQANMAGYWVEGIDATEVTLRKPVGGAGSIVHLQLLSLRHPH